MMLRQWLTVFGVPCTICSDRRPQFTGGWFNIMPSLTGMQHAKSIAYLSQFNGPVEAARRHLFEKLHKIHLGNRRLKYSEEIWPALIAH